MSKNLENNEVEIMSSEQHFLEGYEHYKNAVKLDNDQPINYASLIRSGESPMLVMDEKSYMQAQSMRSECTAAIKAFKKAIDLDPNNINAYFYSAMALKIQGLDKTAEKYLDQGLAKLMNTSHEDLDKSFQELPDSFLQSPESYFDIYVNLSEKAFAEGNYARTLSYLYKFLAASTKDNADLLSMDINGKIDNTIEYGIIEVIDKAAPYFSISHYLEIAGPFRTANDHLKLATVSINLFNSIYSPSVTKKYKESREDEEVKKILSGKSIISCGKIDKYYSSYKDARDTYDNRQKLFDFSSSEKNILIDMHDALFGVPDIQKIEKFKLWIESEAFQCLQEYQKLHKQFPQDRKLLDIALTFAQQGLKENPNNFELQMQEAIAKALISKFMADTEAQDLLDEAKVTFDKLMDLNPEDTKQVLKDLKDSGINIALPSDSIPDLGLSFDDFKEKINNPRIITPESKEYEIQTFSVNTPDSSDETLSTSNTLQLPGGSGTSYSSVIATGVVGLLTVFGIWAYKTYFSNPHNENGLQGENLDDGVPLDQELMGENNPSGD